MAVPHRNTDAGVTLLEVLVVLALLGTMSGAVGLAIGSADRSAGATQEAQLLAARLTRAADEALTTGEPAAFVWENDRYFFLAEGPNGWAPHRVMILGTEHEFGSGVRFAGEVTEGEYVVSGDLLPETGEQLVVLIGRGSGIEAGVVFDGVSARLAGADEL